MCFVKMRGWLERLHPPNGLARSRWIPFNIWHNILLTPHVIYELFCTNRKKTAITIHQTEWNCPLLMILLLLRFPPRNAPSAAEHSSCSHRTKCCSFSIHFQLRFGRAYAKFHEMNSNHWMMLVQRFMNEIELWAYVTSRSASISAINGILYCFLIFFFICLAQTLLIRLVLICRSHKSLMIQFNLNFFFIYQRSNNRICHKQPIWRKRSWKE